MKRLTLLVVLLGVLGVAAGFALELKPSFTLTGSATVTWGVNLDATTTGFNNAGSADLTVNLFNEATDTHAGKEGLYGSITIANLSLYWLDGVLYTGDAVATVPSLTSHEATVTAKLVAGPITVQINAAPAMDSDAAVAIEDGTDTGYALINTILVAETTYLFNQFASGHGTSVKYAADKWSATIDIASQGDYTATTPNTNNGYAVGAEGSLTFSPVTLGLGVFQGITWNPIGTGGYVSAGLDLTGIGTANVGFEFGLPTGGSFSWEIFAKAQMFFNKDKTAYLLARFYYDPQGVNGMDSAVAFMVPAKTLFGPVNFDVTAYLLDLDLATQTIGVLSHAGYTMTLGNGMDVNPQIIAQLVSKMGVAASNTLLLTPEVIVTIAKAPVTTVTLAWTTANLMATPIGLGSITVALAVTY